MAPRHWAVEAPPTLATASGERLRAAIDTLVENAVRYTDEDDIVRLLALPLRDVVLVGVADSGPGMDPERLASLCSSGSGDARPQPPARSDGGTGLGMSIVEYVAALHGGHLVAGHSREGGALVGLTITAS